MPSQIEIAKSWLKNQAYPLWTSAGIAPSGIAFEALTSECKPADAPLRAMVLSRQIFSFCLGKKLGFLERDFAQKLVRTNTNFLLSAFGLPSGAFAHMLGSDGKISNPATELYTQAFAMFALANAYELCGDAVYKSRALDLLRYLQRERRVPAGGYLEIKEGKKLYQANPHMHLFEAALAWMAVDGKQPEWRALADELLELTKSKFIDSKTRTLCEHFTENWEPLKTEGKFIFEPGHHFEWSWLLGVYQELSGVRGLEPIRETLFDLGEKYGVNSDGIVMDEMWSDFSVKKSSSRFWPHCERIKAAVLLRKAASADQALQTLFRYIEGSYPGLWKDTRTEAGEFIGEPVKASSLYHIAAAMAEYIRLRNSL